MVKIVGNEYDASRDSARQGWFDALWTYLPNAKIVINVNGAK